MPTHDWSKVDAGIFHDFHHAWIEEIKRALNAILPPEYYALAEQHAGEFGPEVLTLGTINGDDTDPSELVDSSDTATALLVAPPKVDLTFECDIEFYQRKQKHVAVRHVSDDRIVAVVEVVSWGNKSSANAMRGFIDKAAELLQQGVHLLILDVHPTGSRDPSGIHGAIWHDLAHEDYESPEGKPMTTVAYERALVVKAYVQPLSLGESLRDMPLILEPGAYVLVPLEATYQSAWNALPKRWQKVLEPVAE
ncbi:MAG: DUF4058 family protein [Planctomycetota bacterium]|nr:DUF4058 family protein [Planctomycetota bacterium]